MLYCRANKEGSTSGVIACLLPSAVQLAGRMPLDCVALVIGVSKYAILGRIPEASQEARTLAGRLSEMEPCAHLIICHDQATIRRITKLNEMPTTAASDRTLSPFAPPPVILVVLPDGILTDVTYK